CQNFDGTREGIIDIGEEVTLTAKFIPGCTDVELLEPRDNFVINNSFQNSVPISVGGYDINDATLERIEVQYKLSSESSTEWKLVDEFFKTPTGTQKPISTASITTDFNWNITDQIAFPDGTYNLRVRAHCIQGISTSEIFTGIIDRVNPVQFGTPSPADGILSPGEDISIRFNEPINSGILGFNNFKISGLINGGDIQNTTFLSFDGINDFTSTSFDLNVAGSSFSAELWVNRNNQTGKQTLISHGLTNDAIHMGFDENNFPYFTINRKLADGSVETNTLTGTLAITGDGWTHLAFIYDESDTELRITAAQGATQVTDRLAINIDEVPYRGTGLLFLGKNVATDADYFNGYLHSLRVWSKSRLESEIAVDRNKQLTGRERGILGFWRLDEGVGDRVTDQARRNDMQLEAEWQINPSGSSASFDGNDHIEINAGSLAFTDEVDFTIEFWFKGNGGAIQTLLSNGKGDGTDGNGTGWAIEADATGSILVRNNGILFEAVSNNYFDNDWHHFAMVVNRLNNTTAYVDGEAHNSILSDVWSGFGGARLILGARGFFQANMLQIDQYFTGQLDEVRIWKTSRKVEQLIRDRYNRLNGDEVGLQAYYPFESYGLNAFNLPELTQTFNDEASTFDGISNGSTLVNNSPRIKLQRPVQEINFTFTTNDDEIVLTPNIDNKRIENVILDISVQDIQDLNGNAMAFPITWTAFVDKNAIVWDANQRSIEMNVGESVSFTHSVKNIGGEVSSFEIQNLPDWLSASVTSGTLDPLSETAIEFTIDEAVNIGTYTQGIQLVSSGFDETLDVNLKVIQSLPENWQVDESAFEFTMSVVGRLWIQGEFSRDSDDKLAVFVNGECRGIGDLAYFEDFDNYQTFMTIYSNDQTGTENLSYRIWNASEGRIHTNITVSNSQVETFVQEGIFGSVVAPITFEAGNDVQRQIPLVEGWQWISFNLSSPDMADVNAFMSDFNAQKNDIIKGLNFFDTYDPETGWIGSIGANGGIQNGNMYKFRVTDPGMLDFTGEIVNPSSQVISLIEGWNWISYLGQENAGINVALANVSNVQVGDQIKNQRAFAIYSGPTAGWVGSLTALRPGEGYLYFAQDVGTLTYPASVNSRARGASFADHQGTLNKQFNIRPERYEFNMQVIAKLENLTGNEIILLKNDYQTVGVATPVGEEGKAYHFITSYGNPADELRFYLLEGGEEIPLGTDQKVTFTADKVYGSLENPVLLSREKVVTGYNEQSGAISIYPNPVTDIVTITLENNASVMITELRDLSGRILESYPIHPSQINVSGLTSGIYFINLVMQDGETASFKIIKQ
ncbi:MAG: LamG-like jellyroll fold domain-containing protein, partial [Bacteroidota bacterium]